MCTIASNMSLPLTGIRHYEYLYNRKLIIHGEFKAYLLMNKILTAKKKQHKLNILRALDCHLRSSYWKDCLMKHEP